MANFDNSEVVNIEGGVLTIKVRDLLIPCTSLLYDNLESNENLRISIVNFLISNEIFIKSDMMPCIKSSLQLIQRLNAK